MNASIIRLLSMLAGAGIAALLGTAAKKKTEKMYAPVITEEENPLDKTSITVSFADGMRDGYAWNYTVNENSIIKEIKPEKFNDSAKKINAPSKVRTYVFSAGKNGVAELHFEYCKADDRHSSLYSVTYTVTVRDSRIVRADRAGDLDCLI